HPAAGSHANFYGEALYLGSSAQEGVGCDDTRGPTFDLRPIVQTIPSGPTRPNLKTQWIKPISWSEDWRERSYTVPGGSAFGPAATGFFCGAIGGGSKALVRFVHRPLEFGLALAALALLVVIGL